MLSYIYICTLERVDPPKSLNIDVPITAFSSSAALHLKVTLRRHGPSFWQHP